MHKPDIPEGYWLSASGSLVPEANVRPEDKLEDELVKKLVARAEVISEQLAEFRVYALAEMDAYLDLVRSKYGARKRGTDGNLSLSTYDGSLVVKREVSKRVAFGVELQAAKDLIDACVMRWSEGADGNLRALIFDAFKTDRQGQISSDRVLGLKKLEINDPEWQRAVDAIYDAVRVVGSKTYVRVYRRDGERTRPVSLDIANVGDAS